MLFAQLSDELFKPLASPSRSFNAALLLHLHRRVLGAEPVRKAELLAEIGDFAAGWSDPEVSGDEPISADPTERRTALYRRLLDTGWLIERRERYVPVAEFDPEARLLLEELSRLERGETRSYGGAVLEVLGGLESALSDPANRSEALSNAARGAAAFLSHVRGLAAGMRKVEERILREPDRAKTFRLFFEDFVERHLISDYRTLHTRFNPFRFRASVVREAGRALRDALTVRALAEGLIREGRSADLDAAQRAVRTDLAQILAVFEGLDNHLDAVDAVVARLERRIASALHVMDRPDPSGVERVAAMLRAVGGSEIAPDVPGDVSLLRPPIGHAHLQAPRARKAAIDMEPLPDVEDDPVVDAFAAAKAEFRRRTTVTPESMSAFVEARLGKAVRLRGSQIVIAGVDDFIVFQRLREIDVLFDAKLGERYAVTRLPERVANGWLDCPDFLLERRPYA
ncbi:Wadjet anti-phage system protein JetA family protein [Methylobacterium sp. 391_Methyba4]|uniref:Wadjet anti-phage system protein JetA family protein n=1 Tax=Methylobacterium sp. 391_Methyba4 TaxID=3038924 RepID=UPI00241C3EB1|nr:Wadjet anti-phage system protein JetA family protein [Methylobacterium sp. 391_Methyba4]WFS08748.1 DUF5716 family protein [Methylobacterium sp. 391_Methyba4]